MMGSNQVNISFVEDYSKKLAIQLSEDYFIGKTTATGADLITFSKFDQVNLFAIKGLFEEWKKEISKIESPYFNYKAFEVKEALDSFMNVLSRNILVSEEAFLPLLEKAIFNSILIGADPQLYFEKNYNTGSLIQTETLKQTEKYYRINRAVVSKLVQRLDSMQEVSFQELQKHLTSVLSEIGESEYVNNELLNHLTFLLPISEAQVYLNNKPAIEPTEETSDDSEMKLIIKEPASDSEKSLNEKYESKDQLTLNDMLRNSGATVAESVAKNKLMDIKSALTVNQKFMFINELFKGESWEFDNAITNLSNCPDYESAINMLLTTYADKYHWDTDNEQVAELFELVSRKFFQN